MFSVAYEGLSVYELGWLAWRLLRREYMRGYFDDCLTESQLVEKLAARLNSPDVPFTASWSSARMARVSAKLLVNTAISWWSLREKAPSTSRRGSLMAGAGGADQSTTGTARFRRRMSSEANASGRSRNQQALLSFTSEWSEQSAAAAVPGAAGSSVSASGGGLQSPLSPPDGGNASMMMMAASTTSGTDMPVAVIQHQQPPTTTTTSPATILFKWFEVCSSLVVASTRRSLPRWWQPTSTPTDLSLPLSPAVVLRACGRLGGDCLLGAGPSVAIQDTLLTEAVNAAATKVISTAEGVVHNPWSTISQGQQTRLVLFTRHAKTIDAMLLAVDQPAPLPKVLMSDPLPLPKFWLPITDPDKTFELTAIDHRMMKFAEVRSMSDFGGYEACLEASSDHHQHQPHASAGAGAGVDDHHNLGSSPDRRHHHRPGGPRSNASNSSSARQRHASIESLAASMNMSGATRAFEIHMLAVATSDSRVVVARIRPKQVLNLDASTSNGCAPATTFGANSNKNSNNSSSNNASPSSPALPVVATTCSHEVVSPWTCLRLAVCGQYLVVCGGTNLGDIEWFLVRQGGKSMMRAGSVRCHAGAVRCMVPAPQPQPWFWTCGVADETITLHSFSNSRITGVLPGVVELRRMQFERSLGSPVRLQYDHRTGYLIAMWPTCCKVLVPSLPPNCDLVDIRDEDDPHRHMLADVTVNLGISAPTMALVSVKGDVKVFDLRTFKCIQSVRPVGGTSPQHMSISTFDRIVPFASLAIAVTADHCAGIFCAEEVIPVGSRPTFHSDAPCKFLSVLTVGNEESTTNASSKNGNNSNNNNSAMALRPSQQQAASQQYHQQPRWSFSSQVNALSSATAATTMDSNGNKTEAMMAQQQQQQNDSKANSGRATPIIMGGGRGGGGNSPTGGVSMISNMGSAANVRMVAGRMLMSLRRHVTACRSYIITTTADGLQAFAMDTGRLVPSLRWAVPLRREGGEKIMNVFEDKHRQGIVFVISGSDVTPSRIIFVTVDLGSNPNEMAPSFVAHPEVYIKSEVSPLHGPSGVAGSSGLGLGLGSPSSSPALAGSTTSPNSAGGGGSYYAGGCGVFRMVSSCFTTLTLRGSDITRAKRYQQKQQDRDERHLSLGRKKRLLQQQQQRQQEEEDDDVVFVASLSGSPRRRLVGAGFEPATRSDEDDDDSDSEEPEVMVTTKTATATERDSSSTAKQDVNFGGVSENPPQQAKATTKRRQSFPFGVGTTNKTNDDDDNNNNNDDTSSGGGEVIVSGVASCFTNSSDDESPIVCFTMMFDARKTFHLVIPLGSLRCRKIHSMLRGVKDQSVVVISGLGEIAVVDPIVALREDESIAASYYTFQSSDFNETARAAASRGGHASSSSASVVPEQSSFFAYAQQEQKRQEEQQQQHNNDGDRRNGSNFTAPVAIVGMTPLLICTTESAVNGAGAANKIVVSRPVIAGIGAPQLVARTQTASTFNPVSLYFAEEFRRIVSLEAPRGESALVSIISVYAWVPSASGRHEVTPLSFFKPFECSIGAFLLCPSWDAVILSRSDRPEVCVHAIPSGTYLGSLDAFAGNITGATNSEWQLDVHRRRVVHEARQSGTTTLRQEDSGAAAAARDVTQPRHSVKLLPAVCNAGKDGVLKRKRKDQAESTLHHHQHHQSRQQQLEEQGLSEEELERLHHPAYIKNASPERQLAKDPRPNPFLPAELKPPPAPTPRQQLVRSVNTLQAMNREAQSTARLPDLGTSARVNAEAELKDAYSAFLSQVQPSEPHDTFAPRLGMQDAGVVASRCPLYLPPIEQSRHHHHHHRQQQQHQRREMMQYATAPTMTMNGSTAASASHPSYTARGTDGANGLRPKRRVVLPSSARGVNHL